MSVRMMILANEDVESYCFCEEGRYMWKVKENLEKQRGWPINTPKYALNNT